MKKCTKCYTEKTLGEFCRSTATKDGRHTICKECVNAITAVKLNTPKGRIAHQVAVAKHRAKKKGWACDLTTAWGVGQLKKQDNRCAKTGVTLEFNTGIGARSRENPNTPSLDRVDSRGGYTQDNVQIVSAIYNYAKNQFTDAEVRAMAGALCAASAGCP